MKRWFAAALIILIMLLAGFLTRGIVHPYRSYSGNLIVTLEPGMQAPVVARVLVSRGVLAHRLPFLFLYTIGRLRTHRLLRAGEYMFDRPLSGLDVYRKLIHGDVYLHCVLIPEGFDRFDITRALNHEIGVDKEEFLQVTKDTSLIRDLDPQASSLEGYLFPDTYRFPRGVRPLAVAETMVRRFRQVLKAKLNGDLHESSSSLHDVVTLASLVEKETPDLKERPQVAGVFERRMEKGWPLQCDPTVAYAARLEDPALRSSPVPVTARELNLDSPYNTYHHLGLPPGPIANPGEASIRAALHPTAGDAIYFVSNNHGGHIFSSTLEAHQRNVRRYRREEAALRKLNGAEAQPNSGVMAAGTNAPWVSPPRSSQPKSAAAGSVCSSKHARKKKTRAHHRVSRRASP